MFSPLIIQERVHRKNETYAHTRALRHAVMPAVELSRHRKHERTMFTLGIAAPDTNVGVTLAHFGGRGKPVHRVPWVDDEGAWVGGRSSLRQDSRKAVA